MSWPMFLPLPMPISATSPSECALALAIPWQRSSFLEQLEPSSPREFAKWYRLEHGGSYIAPEILWRNAYGPREAGPITRVLDECAALGVEVDYACTLESLARLAARKRVVILAAHWRSGLLQVSDVLDRSRFVTRLGTEASGVFAELRAQIHGSGHAGLLRAAAESPHDAEILAALVEVLTKILSAKSLQHVGSLREVDADSSYFLSVNREILNAACPSELAAGAGVELCDATYSADAVARALEGRFSGIMDLVVCNSYLLAAAIKKVNPSCVIIANRDRTAPVARLFIARQVLRSLARSPGNYLQLALAIREQL